MYQCKKCKHVSMEYSGQCLNKECRGWNSMVQVDPATIKPAQSAEGYDETRAYPITEIKVTVQQRISTGMPEMDRVLGGEGDNVGQVLGTSILISGEPGIGKSTLLVQGAANIARSTGPVIYATGEEGLEAVTARAHRLGNIHERLHLMSTTRMEYVEARIKELQPIAVIVDSAQTMLIPGIGGEVGSVMQVKAVGTYVGKLIRGERPEVSDRKMIGLIVGHVNKEGVAAGPKTLEHLVDATLEFEGEKDQVLRTLRSKKNRQNTTQDVGVFEMSAKGLIEIQSPSRYFLSQRQAGEAGSVVTATCGVNNRRAILIEVQVLVMSETKRLQISASGLDMPRVQMMCGVLSRKAGVPITGIHLMASAVGGLEIDERAADLSIAIALASAVQNRPVREGLIVFGEVGLMGEVRDVPQARLRLQEAVAMGFRKALVPTLREMEPVEGIELYRAETLEEAIEMGLDERVDTSPPA